MAVFTFFILVDQLDLVIQPEVLSMKQVGVFRIMCQFKKNRNT